MKNPNNIVYPFPLGAQKNVLHSGSGPNGAH